MKCPAPWKAKSFTGALTCLARYDLRSWAECLPPEDRARAEKVVIDAFEKKSPEYGMNIALFSFQWGPLGQCAGQG